MQLIDRRIQGKNKSAVNRERFLRRYKEQIKEAVGRAIKGRSITDIEGGEKISIPSKDINEPTFGHSRGGVWETVRPGNTDYVKGDQFKRQDRSGGRGAGNASNSDETSEDDFAFEVSREEFLQYFFDDLELPNMVKTQLATTTDFKQQRAGYSMSGSAANLHILRSLRGAMGRRIAVGGKTGRRLKAAELACQQLIKQGVTEADPQMIALRQEIAQLRIRLLAIPFLDTYDLRFSNRIKVPKPASQAVMFCLLDVSGSMDEDKKDTAKRFFILLYLFLTRAYEKIELVFIRHHTSALEVDEQDFFNSRESGGTVVSSAIHLLHKILTERYPTAEWNAYVAQASDGDNWDSDSITCRQLLINQIMPLVQYFAYVEITDGEPQNLWEEYAQISEHHAHFAMRKIEQPADIYPVFRDLFKKSVKS